MHLLIKLYVGGTLHNIKILIILLKSSPLHFSLKDRHFLLEIQSTNHVKRFYI